MILALTACAHLRGAELRRVDLRPVDMEGRDYFQHAPADLAPGAPVVIVLHGGSLGGDHGGRKMPARTGFDALADQEGFVAVFPNALGGNWREEDLPYVGAVVDQVVASTGADPGRVYVAGFSNGGFLAQRLACADPTRFAAVASVSGGLPAGVPCEPGRPVRILMINGTADPVVPYAGGPIARNRGRADPVDDTIAGWLARDACAEPPVERGWDTVADRTWVRDLQWCGGEVRLLRIEGGGHAWPGGPPIAPAFLVGPTSRELDATDEIWAWFRPS